MSRGPDAGTRLRRAIEASAAMGGCPAELIESGWKRWASATFAGARHVALFRAAPSAALDRWLAALPDIDLSVPAMLVADLTITGVRCADEMCYISIEALTVDS